MEEIMNGIKQDNINYINDSSLNLLFMSHLRLCFVHETTCHKSCLVSDKLRLKICVKGRNDPVM
jgi:hypothetical protein